MCYASRGLLRDYTTSPINRLLHYAGCCMRMMRLVSGYQEVRLGIKTSRSWLLLVAALAPHYHRHRQAPAPGCWAGRVRNHAPAQPGPVAVVLQTPRCDGVMATVIHAVGIVTLGLPGCWQLRSVSPLVCVFMSLKLSLDVGIIILSMIKCQCSDFKV